MPSVCVVILGVDQDIIHEDYNELVKLFLENLVHQPHKHSRSIGQSKGPHRKLVVMIHTSECYLVDILLSDSKPIVSDSGINL